MGQLSKTLCPKRIRGCTLPVNGSNLEPLWGDRGGTFGREGSPTCGVRGKLFGKKIVCDSRRKHLVVAQRGGNPEHIDGRI